MNLRHRTALVTRGSRGTGGAIALRLTADGADILIGGAGDAAMVAFPADGEAAFIAGQQFSLEGGAAI